MHRCLLLLLSIGSSLSSRADGYWLLHVDVTAPATATPDLTHITWKPPADSHNTLSLSSLEVKQQAAGIGTHTQTISLAVKITGTWMGSDPAPASVEIIESGKAHWAGAYSGVNDSSTGSANDGLEADDQKTGIAQTPTTDANGHALVPRRI